MKKFYLETYGCKLNQADSEIIREILEKNNYQFSSEKEADFVVINSCGVVEKTERKIIKRIRELKKKNKRVILAGCLPLISFKVCKKLADGILGPKNLLSLPIVVKRIFENKKSIFLKKRNFSKIKYLPIKKRKNRAFVIIPISEGCLGNCSYCVSRFARGVLKSFDEKEILRKIEKALDLGFKEIQLTSQDLAIYGLDRGKPSLPDLLNEILKIKENFRVRLGMMNPFFAKRIFSKILKLMESEKIYKFLHLPLQSGSERILKAMNRGYKLKEILKLISQFKKKFKNSLLATDIILGFPMETEKDFKETIKMVKKIKPEILHIFKYSKRERAPASKLKDFPDKIKKERSRILTKISREICEKENKKYLLKKFEALITEKRKDTFLARLPSYKAVILKEGKLGDFVKIKIVNAKPNYLIGEIIRRES